MHWTRLFKFSVMTALFCFGLTLPAVGDLYAHGVNERPSKTPQLQTEGNVDPTNTGATPGSGATGDDTSATGPGSDGTDGSDFNAADGCTGDVDGDGSIGVADLVLILESWGPCHVDCEADLDADGVVGVGDLVTVISHWGLCDILP